MNRVCFKVSGGTSVPKLPTSYPPSFAVTAKLICTFVFAYADCWFSQEAAEIDMLTIYFFHLVQWKEGRKCQILLVVFCETEYKCIKIYCTMTMAQSNIYPEFTCYVK